MTDREMTDHAMENCIETDGIACTARAIPPENNFPHTPTKSA